MTREKILETARLIKQPPAASSEEYGDKREGLAAEINRVMEGRADIETLIGPGNIEMMRDNHRNHARFMESVFFSYSPEVLVDTVLWVFRAYRSHGFHLSYWPAQLDTWVEILKRELTGPAFDDIYPFYRWMIINQPAFAGISDAMIETQNAPSHGGQAEK